MKVLTAAHKSFPRFMIIRSSLKALLILIDSLFLLTSSGSRLCLGMGWGFSHLVDPLNAMHSHGSSCGWHVHSSRLLHHRKVKRYHWDLIGNKPLWKGQHFSNRCVAAAHVEAGLPLLLIETRLILHNVNPPFVRKQIKHKCTGKKQRKKKRIPVSRQKWMK